MAFRPVVSKSIHAMMNPLRQQKRNMSVMDTLVNKKNNVPELQKMFTSNPHLHGAENPTYLKGKHDKSVMMFLGVLLSFGTLGALRGIYLTSNGLGKIEN